MEDSPLLLDGHSHRVLFHSPGYAEEGWLEAFSVRLEGPGLFAEAVVGSANAGEELVQFFSALASDWRGWEGEKSWVAFEKDLAVSAATTRQGRVSITFSLRRPEHDESWSTKATICCYAGELQVLANRVSDFFGR